MFALLGRAHAICSEYTYMGIPIQYMFVFAVGLKQICPRDVQTISYMRLALHHESRTTVVLIYNICVYAYNHCHCRKARTFDN